MVSIKPFKGQDYETLKHQYNAQNLFVDREFPANPSTLSHTGRKFHHLEWRRVTDIIQNPQFVIKSFHRGDLDQGVLGNCWFLAAVGAVTLHPDLLERVIPPNQSFDRHKYAGIFHFRFWISGQWHDVVIDDFLPCKSNGTLVFCHNRIDENEVWGSLLEKAYAKVCGSYEAMEGGSSVEGLIDMTGGIDEEFSLHDPDDRKFGNIEELEHFVIQAYQHHSMLGCAISAERSSVRDSQVGSESQLTNGLLTGHAYSITSINEVNTDSGCEVIVRCLNPWGDETEWNGRFSDRSTVWNEISNEEKQRLKLRERHDGEFWMSFEDFAHNFDYLSICHRPPDSAGENGMSTWNEAVFHGKWIPGITAAGCGNDNNRNFFKNPQYLINIDPTNNIDDSCTVLVALMQKNSHRCRMRGTQDLTIGFALCKVNDNVSIRDTIQQGNLKFNANQVVRVDDSGSYINQRQVTKRFTVPPGVYVLIPSTFNPNEEGEFLLRIFTENKLNGEEIDQHQGIFSQTEDDPYESNGDQFEYSNDHHPSRRRDVPYGDADDDGDHHNHHKDRFRYSPSDFNDSDFDRPHVSYHIQDSRTDPNDQPCSIM